MILRFNDKILLRIVFLKPDHDIKASLSFVLMTNKKKKNKTKLEEQIKFNLTSELLIQLFMIFLFGVYRIKFRFACPIELNLTIVVWRDLATHTIQWLGTRHKRLTTG